MLLIVRVLERARLEKLLGYADDLGLDALVEVHTPAELRIALDAGASVIGVNSRDLDTFRHRPESAWKIVRQIPADRVAVAESGLGEGLGRGVWSLKPVPMRSSSGRRSRRRLLRSDCWASYPACRDMTVKIKVCGLLRPVDAVRSVEAGASYLGVVFAGGPRAVTPAGR